MGLITVQH